MTPEKFRYLMCPIRHFENVVKFIEIQQNLIVACDIQNNIGIFLINENDLENDDDTLKSVAFQVDGTVEFLQLRNDTLTIVTSSGKIMVMSVKATTVDYFEVVQLKEIDLGISPDALRLYVGHADQEQRYLFISQYPLDGNEFVKD